MYLPLARCHQKSLFDTCTMRKEMKKKRKKEIIASSLNMFVMLFPEAERLSLPLDIGLF